MSDSDQAALIERLRAAAEERRGVNEPTALYRLYDSDDALVYVGITKNIARRMHDHKGKVWWRQVSRREVAWLDSRPEALLAERRTVIAALRRADSDASLRAAVILAGRGASILKLSTAVDTIADGEGGKLPLHTGSLTLNARGNRAMWAESSEPTLKP